MWSLNFQMKRAYILFAFGPQKRGPRLKKYQFNTIYFTEILRGTSIYHPNIDVFGKVCLKNGCLLGGAHLFTNLWFIYLFV